MNARAMFVWSAGALTVALVSNNPVYRALVSLAALAVLQAGLPDARRLRPLLIGACFAAAFAVLLNLLTSHTGVHVIVRLPEALPLIGGPLTLESAAFGAAMGLGIVAALLAVAPLSLLLEPHDVVDALPRTLERTGIAVAASLNLVGGMGRTFASVRDAQRMRGWRPRGLRSWNEVLVPVVLTAIEDSVLLAEAMESRAFGAARRTSFATARWSGWDVAVAVTSAAAAALFLAARLGGGLTDWYPYPSLTLPSVQALLVLGCLALAMPALRPGRPAGGEQGARVGPSQPWP